MFVSDCLGLNELGHLTIGGVDTIDLAERYSTPLYVMDEEEIRKNCRTYREAIEKITGGKGTVIYASKAMCCKEMCRIVADEGLSLDVVSLGELYTALKAGFPMEKVYFHGNNKTIDEMFAAIEYGVGTIVVDNCNELDWIDHLAMANNKRVDILLRITPGVDAHTHQAIKTGLVDSKFGFQLDSGEAFDSLRKAAQMQNVNLVGAHCHIGSQIFESQPYETAVEIMAKFLGKMKRDAGVTIKRLNIGGGFAIPYLPSEEHIDIESVLTKIYKKLSEECSKNDIEIPELLIEPGRSIVGSAGITLYTIGNIKEIEGIRTYISVDGGMSDNPRYALYRSKYQAVVAANAHLPLTQKVTVAGKCCESGDLLGENMIIQEYQEGDILAVLATGAYNYSMASNYNRIPRPAVVMVRDGESRIVVQRESLDDIIKNDI